MQNLSNFDSASIRFTTISPLRYALDESEAPFDPMHLTILLCPHVIRSLIKVALDFGSNRFFICGSEIFSDILAFKTSKGSEISAVCRVSTIVESRGAFVLA